MVFGSKSDKYYEMKIYDLQQQIDALVVQNDNLEKKCKALKEYRDKYNDMIKEQIIEEVKEEIVDEELERKINSETIEMIANRIVDENEFNIGFIPDWVEKKLYKNTMIMSLRLLEIILSKGSIDMLGHKMTINLNPSDNKN